MSERVTLELPEDVARRAREVATETDRRLEEVLMDWIGRAASSITEEGAAEPGHRWRHLVARPHLRRKQPTIRGRNVTVGQLVSTIQANRYSVEAAAANLGLLQEAIEEALRYFEENRELIEAEAEAERRWLAERGYPLEPHDLPR